MMNPNNVAISTPETDPTRLSTPLPSVHGEDSAAAGPCVEDKGIKDQLQTGINDTLFNAFVQMPPAADDSRDSARDRDLGSIGPPLPLPLPWPLATPPDADAFLGHRDPAHAQHSGGEALATSLLAQSLLMASVLGTYEPAALATILTPPVSLAASCDARAVAAAPVVETGPVKESEAVEKVPPTTLEQELAPSLSPPPSPSPMPQGIHALRPRCTKGEATASTSPCMQRSAGSSTLVDGKYDGGDDNKGTKVDEDEGYKGSDAEVDEGQDEDVKDASIKNKSDKQEDPTAVGKAKSKRKKGKGRKVKDESDDEEPIMILTNTRRTATKCPLLPVELPYPKNIIRPDQPILPPRGSAGKKRARCDDDDNDGTALTPREKMLRDRRLRNTISGRMSRARKQAKIEVLEAKGTRLVEQLHETELKVHQLKQLIVAKDRVIMNLTGGAKVPVHVAPAASHAASPTVVIPAADVAALVAKVSALEEHVAHLAAEGKGRGALDFGAAAIVEGGEV
ncbi:hypothetical protein GGF32_001692 [Allomyces javanicus]|nr:hypothetical protein GGF32_001692 [Allomyces javanicus]